MCASNLYCPFMTANSIVNKNLESKVALSSMLEKKNMNFSLLRMVLAVLNCDFVAPE